MKASGWFFAVIGGVVLAVITLVMLPVMITTANTAQWATVDGAANYLTAKGYIVEAAAGIPATRVPFADAAGDIMTSNAAFTFTPGTATLSTTNLTVTGTLDTPTGRTATYVVAASDAPAHVKAQADYVCDGTADDVEIQAAIDALPASGGLVHLSTGNFHTVAPIRLEEHCIQICGESQGWSASGFDDVGAVGTTRITTDANVIDAIWVGVNGGDNLRGIKITDLTISGSAYNNGKAGIYTPPTNFKIDSPIVSDLSIDHFSYGILMTCDSGYFERLQILACTNGIWFQDNGTMGQLLNTVTFAMMGDLAGVGIHEAAKVENCNFVGADNAHHMTIAIDECEIVNGCFISGYNGAGTEPDVGIYNSNAGKYLNIIISNNKINNCIIGIQTHNIDGELINGNLVDSCHSLGMQLYTSTNLTVTNNHVLDTVSFQGIAFNQTSYSLVNGNHVYDNGQFGIHLGDSSTYMTITNNYLENNPNGNIGFGTGCSNNYINGNTGYIASGEVRTASGSLTGGAANAILFSWHNPEAQDIYIKKVVITITTADADAANIDVGIADDATYTNGGTEFFNDLTGETILVYDSWVAGDNGQQTKWVLCQDSASATDGWVVAKILDADGSSIVGSYYIEYVGK